MSETDTLEAVARAIDPEAWDSKNMIPTRAITTAMHQRRQDSCEQARAALEAVLDDMAEPSEAMKTAGRESLRRNGLMHPQPPTMQKILGPCFDAMLAQYHKENLT